MGNFSYELQDRDYMSLFSATYDAGPDNQQYLNNLGKKLGETQTIMDSYTLTKIENVSNLGKPGYVLITEFPKSDLYSYEATWFDENRNIVYKIGLTTVDKKVLADNKELFDKIIKSVAFPINKGF